MILRYLTDLFYYDGPLSQAFIDMETFEVYASFLVSGPMMPGEMTEWVYVVRKFIPADLDTENYFFPPGFFHTTQTDVPFFLLEEIKMKERKEWNEKFPTLECEVRPLTDEEREKYAPDTEK